MLSRSDTVYLEISVYVTIYYAYIHTFPVKKNVHQSMHVRLVCCLASALCSQPGTTIA